MNLNLFYRLSILFIFCSVLLIPCDVKAQKELTSIRFSILHQSIDESLKIESKAIEKIRGLKAAIDQFITEVNVEVNTYKIQEPVYSNQLLNPDIQIKLLEKTHLEIITALRTITERYKESKQKQEEVEKVRIQTNELMTVTENQIQDIRSETKTDPEIPMVIKKLENLAKSLAEKKDLLQQTHETYVSIIERLDGVRNRYTSLENKYKDVIEAREKQILLERTKIYESMGLKKISTDAHQITMGFRNALTKDFWKNQFGVIKISGEMFILSFSMIFIIIMVLVFRLRKKLTELKNNPVFKEKYWNHTLIFLFRRSFKLLGITLFLYVVLQTERFQPKPIILNAGFNLLLVWLFTQWFLDILKITNEENQPVVPAKLVSRIRLHISIIRFFTIYYIIVSWLDTSNSSMVILGRLLFEIFLYISIMSFWSSMDKWTNSHQQDEEDNTKPVFHKLIAAIRPLTYLIILVGFTLDITGYGSLSQLWFVSWGRSFIVALWGGLLFLSIREWDPKLKTDQELHDEDISKTKNSLQWMGVQFLTLLWFAMIILMFVLAWGGKQTVIMKMFQFIKMPFQVGSMQFSLLGFMTAIPILLITQGVVTVWRHVFFVNILGQSGMEEGLKESVTTISVYIIWTIGIVIALNAFGFDSTSLTVVLGALGIGIGFGLQNIFNNFLSGVILLFERPIQVGDDIEVNGVWATVKKINVRSTIVQTYDNASLIIPNSDLISTQVTNWSFKDKRLRRNINVGVAYGSDTELVKETLLEVAANTPRVLKLPKPDVIFIDFGDNALNFRLRIWTRLEYFYAVESAVRFEIDRMFKDRNIVIAFPQRDIHIKSDLNNQGDNVQKSLKNEPEAAK